MRLPSRRLALLLATVSAVACATGADPDSGGEVVVPSEGDAGLVDAGPTPGDDAQAPPTPVSTGEAGTPSDDAASSAPVVDAAPNDDVSAPVPDSAPPPPPPVVDAGPPPACVGYASPSTPANCTCNPATHACAANGCYNGYWCETSLTPNKCVSAPPSGC